METEFLKGKKRFSRVDDIDLGSDGWLSPKGDYYKVGTTEHGESAEWLVDGYGERELTIVMT